MSVVITVLQQDHRQLSGATFAYRIAVHDAVTDWGFGVFRGSGWESYFIFASLRF